MTNAWSLSEAETSGYSSIVTRNIRYYVSGPQHIPTRLDVFFYIEPEGHHEVHDDGRAQGDERGINEI